MEQIYNNTSYGVAMFYTFLFLLTSNIMYFIYSVLS